MGVCGAGCSAGSADGGKLWRWPLTQEAERGLGAFFQGGQVQTPGLLAVLTWLVWPWPQRPSLSPFPGRPLPGDEQALQISLTAHKQALSAGQRAHAGLTACVPMSQGLGCPDRVATRGLPESWRAAGVSCGGPMARITGHPTPCRSAGGSWGGADVRASASSRRKWACASSASPAPPGRTTRARHWEQKGTSPRPPSRFLAVLVPQGSQL